MPQHLENTNMFLDITIITMILKLYPMNIAITLNTDKIFQTQALLEQPTQQLHQLCSKINLHHKHSREFWNNKSDINYSHNQISTQTSNKFIFSHLALGWWGVGVQWHLIEFLKLIGGAMNLAKELDNNHFFTTCQS